MTVILNSVQGRSGEKVTMEQRCEGGKNASSYIPRGRIFQAEGTATSRAWKQWLELIGTRRQRRKVGSER